jgi:hypothetical protein
LCKRCRSQFWLMHSSKQRHRYCECIVERWFGVFLYCVSLNADVLKWKHRSNICNIRLLTCGFATRVNCFISFLLTWTPPPSMNSVHRAYANITPSPPPHLLLIFAFPKHYFTHLQVQNGVVLFLFFLSLASKLHHDWYTSSLLHFLLVSLILACLTQP